METQIKLTYYQLNKEKMLEWQKKYNKEHQEECIVRNRKYYNKDYFREYHRKKKNIISNILSVN